MRGTPKTGAAQPVLHWSFDQNHSQQQPGFGAELVATLRDYYRQAAPAPEGTTAYRVLPNFWSGYQPEPVTDLAIGSVEVHRARAATGETDYRVTARNTTSGEHATYTFRAVADRWRSLTGDWQIEVRSDAGGAYRRYRATGTLGAPGRGAARPIRLRFFVRGFSYRFLWVIPSDLHLFGVEEGGRLSLLGTDTLGRDLYSRLLVGGQVSLSVPFVGVGLSMLIGTILGVISGYFGGRVDHYIQRSIEILLSFPSLPLCMALAAAMPVTMASTTRYVLIVVILSLIGWGSLARVVRGKVLQYRGEEYVAAAEMSGAGLRRIIFRHLIPGTLSHLIVSATLGIPGMILGESSLSFLGVGITPPLTSWGLLLSDAQKTEVLVNHQWLMIPGLLITVIVLAFNFFGDGLRDAADPYA